MIHKLLMIEWRDSAQPISSWKYLADLPSCESIQCVSVGWAIKETSETLMLAPNIGDYESGEGAQGSGFIRIPKVSITRITELEEITSSSLSSHLGSKPMPLVS